MLHPETIVQWMDVKSQKVFTDGIAKMFQMYSHMASKTSDGSEVLFSPQSNIAKITDMYGWTSVKAIRRIDNVPEWFELNIANHQITLSRDSIIPIYEPNSPFLGFHGETKYPFTGKHITNIEEWDMARIRRGKNKDGEDIEFSNISLSKVMYIFEKTLCVSYEVITKSGFFNGNNIHLFGITGNVIIKPTIAY
jgi:hypothetical protein